MPTTYWFQTWYIIWAINSMDPISPSVSGKLQRIYGKPLPFTTKCLILYAGNPLFVEMFRILLGKKVVSSCFLLSVGFLCEKKH